MNKTEVLNILRNAEWPASNIMEIICNIAKDGKVVHPNQSILVTGCSVDYDEEDRDYCDTCDDDQIVMNNHWIVCDGVEEFEDEVGDNPEETDCSGFYVSEFKEVREFVSDFC